METVSYSDVLTGAADLAGLDSANISSQDAAVLRGMISKRLTCAWVNQRWPDLCRNQKRYFRPIYSSTATYEAGTEIFYPTTQRYYRTITDALTGTPPADADDATDCFNWQAIDVVYSGPDWSDAASYTAGSIVYDPGTDVFYWARVATTIGAALSDDTQWAVLEPFIRYASLTQPGQDRIGSVFQVKDKDYRADLRACELLWELTENGVQVMSNVSFVWINFRRPWPVLRGSVYSSTAEYVTGQQIYTDGNFYDVAADTTAGDTPASAPDSFTLVSIPLIFKQYLEHGAAADFLDSDAKQDQAARFHQFAADLLAEQASLLVGQQGQRQKTVVETR